MNRVPGKRQGHRSGFLRSHNDQLPYGDGQDTDTGEDRRCLPASAQEAEPVAFAIYLHAGTQVPDI